MKRVLICRGGKSLCDEVHVLCGREAVSLKDHPGIFRYACPQTPKSGVKLKTRVFATREKWQNYAVDALQTVERLGAEIGVADQLHRWPDKSLGSVRVVSRMSNQKEYHRWLQKWW